MQKTIERLTRGDADRMLNDAGARLYVLEAENERLRDERDRLYDHTRHLVSVIVGMNKNEQVCDAAAYLTQITPPLSR